LDNSGRALYFSRAPIPYLRNDADEEQSMYLHWGIYAYRRQLLYDFITWPQGSLEKVESLEQLRALENGVDILVALTDQESVGVDVPEDIAEVEQLLSQN
jgi:3-deoxy-manno-octulosonate cytidylyltransferase (CMP-KDO synthetase)